jgi:hypothetical protein
VAAVLRRRSARVDSLVGFARAKGVSTCSLLSARWSLSPRSWAAI